MSKVVLITGAFGFVGTNLSAYLAEKGYELWALDLLRPLSGRKGESYCDEGLVAMERVKVGESQRGSAKLLHSNSQPVSGGENGGGTAAYSRCFTWKELGAVPWGEVDAVVHLAGKAHDTKNASDPQSYFDVNVGLTEKVLEAWRSGMWDVECGKWNVGCGKREVGSGSGKWNVGCGKWEVGSGGDGGSSKALKCESSELAADGVAGEGEVQHSTSRVPHPTNTLCASAPLREKMFILFSSVKAVADRVEGVLMEDAVSDPQTPYGRSKLAAERLLRPLSGLNDEGSRDCEMVNKSHPHTYILRPCMIHGPGNKGNLNLLYSVVRRGVPWPLGAFDNQRSFASIGNVCAVVEGLLMGDVAAGVYQVADDDALSTNELIELIAGALGRKPRVWRVPVQLVRVAAKIGDVLRLPLNSERLKKLTESYVVSNAKVKAALGWERMPVSAEEGMRIALESLSRKDAKARRVEEDNLNG